MSLFVKIQTMNYFKHPSKTFYLDATLSHIVIFTSIESSRLTVKEDIQVQGQSYNSVYH